MNAQLSVRRVACSVVAALAALSTLTVAQTPTPPPLPSAELFNSDVVQRIDLRLHSSDWEKLKQEFRTNEYYPADLIFKGETVRNIGIRSRGLGSRSGTKPGLRVDMDRYTDDLTFLGLKSFNLDNLTQDASTVKETMAMKFFARLKIPAPREAHARLYVNNVFAGLYGIVESIDKRFLARVFGIVAEDTQNDGFLYEFHYINQWKFNYLGSDLEQYKLRFEPKTHENKSDQTKLGPIEELVRLANDTPVDQFMSVVGERLDLPAFMRYMAAQNYVAQNDGFLGYDGMNNFYLYRLENSSKHVFIAWDEDNAFIALDFPITLRHDENVLMSKAMQIPELRDTYYAGLAEAVTSAGEPTGPNNMPWLEFEMRRQMDLIADVIREDQLKPYSITDHETERARLILFAQGRSQLVNALLPARTSSSLRRP